MAENITPKFVTPDLEKLDPATRYVVEVLLNSGIAEQITQSVSRQMNDWNFKGQMDGFVKDAVARVINKTIERPEYVAMIETAVQEKLTKEVVLETVDKVVSSLRNRY